MKEKKSFAKSAGDFLAGRGFYIVLLVCIAIIGLSTWALLTSNKPADSGLSSTPVVNLTPDQNSVPAFNPATPTPTSLPTQAPSPAPLPTPTPTKAPEPTKKPEPSKKPAVSSGYSSIDEIAFIWPVIGNIIQEYSVEALVYNRTMGDWRTHRGVDVAAAIGAKIYAVADGTVSDILQDDMLGTVVIIDHGLDLKSKYCNLAATPTVKKGDKIASGAVIGSVGETALGETGDVSHLHFEMEKDGETVDPLKYLPKN
ncbi:MAG: M23 family metallopeptidase [Oscillospiraceae bacterium]|nr:M23 family metallopeptidase [Oscillospiraceae bacterium]